MTESLGLGDALLVTLIGMIIVFFGLTVLIFLIKALVALTQNLGKKNTAPKVVGTIEPTRMPAAEAATEAADEDDPAVIAAITAALVCVMAPGTAFTVRRVRRVQNAAAWQRAGREEQIHSRF